MSIELNPEQEHVIEQALQAGLIESAAEVIDAGVEAIRQRLQARLAPSTLSGDEWMRKFRSWAQSHSPDTPLLSDEGMSRESIYRERGL